MNTIKHRFIYGAMAGGVLFATALAPAQAVLAATASDDTPAASAGTTSSQTPSTNTHRHRQGQGTSGSTTNDGQGSGTANSSPTSTTPDVSANTTAATPSNGAPANSPNQTSTNNSNSPGASNTQSDTGQAVTSATISDARSGDVTAKGNLSSVGNATSGNATVGDTQVTTLNSNTTLTSAGGLQTFTFNINGNHDGDITLSPADFLQSSAATAVQTPEDGSVTTETDSTITNTIDLSAASGDVKVQGNMGNTGNATSGNAATELNLINMIDSTVSDKQAFVGMVNINGNLNGNLLLPKSAVDELLPNSSAATSTNSSESTATTDNNMTVNNNVTLDATSGGVTVEGNGGTSGSATSGNAVNNLKLYNMTNSQIVGGNVLLVFVNVEGSWVGLLMNAPTGTTSAALGGGITKDTTAPTNSATTGTNETINNNVKLDSASGNVKVQGNMGNTGNATSGNASASADIVNVLGSQVDLTGWLGVLVINVYGSWNGSLEIQSANTTIHVKAPLVHHNSTNQAVTPTAANASAASELTGIALASAHLPGGTTTKSTDTALGAHTASGLGGNAHKDNLVSSAMLTIAGAALAITGGATQLLTNRRKRLP